MSYTLLWIIIAITFLVIELLAGNFVMICFTIGSIIAIFTALIGLSFTAQVVVFAICSSLSIFFLRPIVIKYFHKEKERKSNADAIIGRLGKVVEPIEKDGYGRVALDGDVWKAQTMNGNAISEGPPVKIIDRKSTIVIVEPFK